MKYRLEQRKHDFLTTIFNQTDPGSWHKKTEELEKYIKVKQNEQESKRQNKKNIKIATQKKFKEEIDKRGREKSKVQHLIEGRKSWKVGGRPKYMNNLNRQETSIIFKARTRMLDVKNNFRGKQEKSDILCRSCGKMPETQKHVLEECKTIHTTCATRVFKYDIFSENPTWLRIVTKKITRAMQILGQPK